MIKEAIILAGGYGTRLKSIISDIPKPMAPIGDRPFLEIQLDVLKKKGIEHTILSLGYKADFIQSHFKDQYHGMKLSYAIEKEKLDTGGAIRLAMTKMTGRYVYILNGDSFLDADITLASKWVKKWDAPVIFGYTVECTKRYGRIEHDDGLISHFTEKGIEGPGVINAGVYVFPQNLLDSFPPHTPFSIETDYFLKLKKANGFRVLVTDNYFIDIGIPADYARAQIELKQYFI